MYTAEAIVVDNYTDAKNKRFEGSSTFIGNNYDWSGVGRSTSGRWATLIGENYFISANHFPPRTGEQIHFVNGNNASNPPLSYTVAGGTRVGSTDLWIGWTKEAMDSSLARYSLRAQAANTLAETGLSGAEVFMSGDFISGDAGSVKDHVVATNRVESYREQGTTDMETSELTVSFGSAAGWDQLALFRNIDGDNAPLPTDHEGQLQSGDSGSPLFWVSENSLVIVGVGWAVASDVPGNFVNTPGTAGSGRDPFENRDATFYTYVGSYDSEITAAIALVPDSVPAISVTVDDAEAEEFDTSNTGLYSFTADVAPDNDISIIYALSGSATNGADYTALSGSVTLSSGQTSVTFPVTAVTDSEVEGDEVLTLTLSSSANYAVAVASGDVIIKDLPFDEYRSDLFGDSTDNIGPAEDFDSDGIANLVEYAFGLDALAVSQLPLTWKLLEDTNEFQLDFEKDTTLVDIDYIVETSSTLLVESWEESGFTLELGTIVNGKQPVRAKMPISDGSKFIRVRVERIQP